MAVFAPAMHHTTPHRSGFLHWILSGVVLLILVLALSSLSRANETGPVSCSPPQCAAPPPQQGTLRALDRYTSSRYGFSPDYSPSIPPTQQSATSIAWDGTLEDRSEVNWTLLGASANGRSAQQIVGDAQTANFPDAQQVYTIPGAALGYVPGYGNVYDLSVDTASGQAIHDRLVIMASIRGGLAVVVAGEGPYQPSTPGGSSHPNPAETPLVHLGEFEESINSVTWPGEPPL